MQLIHFPRVIAVLSVVFSASFLIADDTPLDAGARDEPSERYELAYKFKAGEKIRWAVVHQATVKTTIRGTTQTAKTRTDSAKAWEVGDVTPEGEVELVHRVEWVKMTNQLPNRASTEYDSRTDATPPNGFEQAAQAVGIPLSQVRMTGSGKVVKREQKHIQPGTSGDNPFTIPLPEGPVAVGHVWTEPHEVVVSLKGGEQRQIKTRRRFELSSVKNGIATIDVAYQILTPIHDPAVEGQLIQRLIEGEVKFDVEAGRIVAKQMEIDRRVLGFSGKHSAMHYRMRLTERLLKPDELVAKKPKQPLGPEPLNLETLTK